MRTIVLATIPVVVLSLTGCGERNPPAQVPAMSPEQVAAEEKYFLDVSAAEKQHDALLAKTVYIPHEEAVVDEAERA
ncbi:MAG: hypothetical protein ACRC7O_11375, partial [Fimbriiglobus sp.]